jgi:hypothetical protein
MEKLLSLMRNEVNLPWVPDSSSAVFIEIIRKVGSAAREHHPVKE